MKYGHCNVFFVGPILDHGHISTRFPLLDIKALNDDDGVDNQYEPLSERNPRLSSGLASALVLYALFEDFEGGSPTEQGRNRHSKSALMTAPTDRTELVEQSGCALALSVPITLLRTAVGG